MNLFEHNDAFFDDDGFENMDERVRYYQRIIRSHGKVRTDMPAEDIIESLVDYCITHDRFSDAFEFCNIWLIHNKNSAEAHHKSAIILSQMNKPVEALKSINKAIELAPYMKDALITQAMIYEQLGDVKKGLAIIDSILAYDSGNEEILFRKAMLLQSAGNTNQALEILIYLENIEYLLEEVYQEMAHCYHLMYDYKKSAYYYEKAIDLNPFDHLIWYNLGVMYGNNGANYKAIDCYKMVLTLNDKFLPAMFNLGNAYAVTARLVEAIEMYSELLRQSPNDIETLHNLASTFADNKQYLSAIENYTNIILIEPEYYQAYFGRGSCFDSLDNFERAIDDYNSALIYSPSSKSILQAKADLLFNFGRISESLNCYLQALELDPNDEHSIYDVAYIYFEFGDYDSAANYANRLIDLSYSYADAWFLLAKIYSVRNNEKKAAKYLIEAIKIDATKYDEFLKEFPALTKNIIKIQSLIDKGLNPRKSLF